DALVRGRGDPLLAELLALELELESVVVTGRRGALQDGSSLEHLHADEPFVLDRLRHELFVEDLQHLSFARRSYVHFDVEPDVFRLRHLRRRLRRQTTDAKRRHGGAHHRSQNSASVHVTPPDLPWELCLCLY